MNFFGDFLRRGQYAHLIHLIPGHFTYVGESDGQAGCWTPFASLGLVDLDTGHVGVAVAASGAVDPAVVQDGGVKPASFAEHRGPLFPGVGRQVVSLHLAQAFTPVEASTDDESVAEADHARGAPGVLHAGDGDVDILVQGRRSRAFADWALEAGFEAGLGYRSGHGRARV